MLQNGLVDRETAARLAFKFAGETFTDQEIDDILGNAPDPQPPLAHPTAPVGGRGAGGEGQAGGEGKEDQ